MNRLVITAATVLAVAAVLAVLAGATINAIGHAADVAGRDYVTLWRDGRQVTCLRDVDSAGRVWLVDCDYVTP